MGLCAFGQAPASITELSDQALLPSGVSKLPINLNGRMVYAFKDEDGASALHFIGDFVLTVGEGEGQQLRSREAVAWITQLALDGRAYRHLQILLWRDAEIQEVGGTVTRGPALFVTLSTFGEITMDADDVTFQSSAHTRVFAEGQAIRKAISTGVLRGSTEDVHMRVFDASGLKEKKTPTPRPVIQVQSEGELSITEDEEGRRVLTISGGVYLSRGLPQTGEYLEIQADSVVVFLPPSDPLPPEPTAPTAGLGGGAPRRPRPTGDSRLPRGRSDEIEASEQQLLSTGLGDVAIEAAYLEGDVVMRQGSSMIRASRLYYDFLLDRALILDAVVRTTIANRNIPLYVRASEIRQLSRNRFTAYHAILSTNEFYTPHYHVGAGHIELINRTPAKPMGERSAISAGSFRIRHATLNVGGHPIIYWPYIRGNIDTSETSIKSVRTGYSDDFGLEFETDWHLFNVLGLETPAGFDSTLSLDYFTRRGPALGVEARYQRDRYFGIVRSYLLADSEEDFLGRKREQLSARNVRGRVLLRHRQLLEEDWQVSLELSYVSDEGFLEEFFESEFDNDKEQETLLYLKKQRDNWAFTALIQARILDFTTQTERLPDFGLHLAGEPLGNGVTFFSENRVGILRLSSADQTFLELIRNGRLQHSETVSRVDTRQEFDMPIDLGPVRLVPFVSLRGTAWQDSPHHGRLARAFAVYGVRASMYLSRVYPDFRSTLFDIDGVRHIVKPDIVAWVSHTNRDSADLFPFDETVEGIDEVDGVVLGLRQRWQTKRGGESTRRTVEFLTLDLEAGLFADARSDDITNGFASFSRPENSISRNYLNSAFIWRLNDRTALLSECNFDVNDGEVDILNVSLAVERSPRLSYLLGYRFIEESDSNLFAFDMNYRLTEKHTLAVRELYDFAEGRTLDFTIALIRKFPGWFSAVSFILDESENDFGVSLSIWPEGLPRATLGSRRFTRLGRTTRLRNN